MAESLRLSDCKCPICLCILIEPVRMPCNHELCMPCFKQNVQEANLSCPMCRMRISSWARKHARDGTLIDKQRWKKIQEAFPEVCKKRIEGIDDNEEDSELDSPVKTPTVAQPGELRQEYEAEVNKFMKIKEEENALAIKKSEEFIEKLQQEEVRFVEEKKRILEEQQRTDAELARLLKEAEEENEQMRIRKLQAENDEKYARKLQEEENLRQNTISKMTSQAHKSGSAKGPTTKIPRIEDMFKKMGKKPKTLFIDYQDFTNQPSCSTTSPVSEPSLKDMFEIPSTSGSQKSASSKPQQELPSLPPDFQETEYWRRPDLKGLASRKPEERINVSESEQPKLPSLDDIPVTQKRARSTESEDSITTEINHFKPIVRSPRTARKRLADGSRLSPPIIHTTPRNLRDLGESSSKSTPIHASRMRELVQDVTEGRSSSTKGTMTRRADKKKGIQERNVKLLITQTKTVREEREKSKCVRKVLQSEDELDGTAVVTESSSVENAYLQTFQSDNGLAPSTEEGKSTLETLNEDEEKYAMRQKKIREKLKQYTLRSKTETVSYGGGDVSNSAGLDRVSNGDQKHSEETDSENSRDAFSSLGCGNLVENLREEDRASSRGPSRKKRKLLQSVQDENANLKRDFSSVEKEVIDEKEPKTLLEKSAKGGVLRAPLQRRRHVSKNNAEDSGVDTSLESETGSEPPSQMAIPKKRKSGQNTLMRYMELMSAEEQRLRQEEMDRRLAMELQEQLDQEPLSVSVDRRKGTDDAYPLRQKSQKNFCEFYAEEEFD